MALGVAMGVFVGCTPLWGAHLAMAVLLASVLRLNRFLVYAAANVANPLTVGPILFVELQIGHRILHGTWLALRMDEVRQVGLTGFVTALLLGGLLFGLAAGALAWIIVYPTVRAGRRPEAWVALADRVALRYVDASVRDAEASRAVVLRDPLFRFLLGEEAFARAGSVLDLGCSRGVLAVVCEEAGAPHGPFRYIGVERAERYVRVARQVFADREDRVVHHADLRDFDPPAADVTVVADTLRFLPPSSQDALLRRLGNVLPAGGRIYLREVDRGAPLPWFALTVAADALAQFLPGRSRHGLHYRRAGDLRNALMAAGFEVADRSALWGRKSRVLLEAVRPDSV
jgi:SAM-dependent methyltransferase